ncbi:MAG: putative baseplate assembly protein [Chloroflexi bacterium]|nr:putative baseplate assembly protein [Chloroflexota bacterium]
MTLYHPDLDQRTFQDLVDEARRRIPALTPEWTDHNVSDPGIALIELFAWMTESLLYRVNQMPERLYIKFLELMGITLHPPAPARADLTFRLAAPQAETVGIPVGTEVATVQTAEREAIVFHTTRDVLVVSPRLSTALTASAGVSPVYRDRWDELRSLQTGLGAEHGVACFEQLEPGEAIYLGFDQSLRDNLVQLTIYANIAGVGVRPEDPPLAWEVSTGDRWLAAEVLRDETGGLNRGGVVELQVPPQHEAITLGGRGAYWIRARLLAARDGQEPYRRSPELRGVVAVSNGALAPALHGSHVENEVLGLSDGRPAQILQVENPPVLSRQDGQTVVIQLPDGGVEFWTEIEDFGISGPDDRHFTWESTSGEIRFGPRIRLADGIERQHGAVPPEGATVRVTGYLTGGGRSGNVGSGQLTVMRSTIPFVDTVSNRRSASGGADGESVTEALARGPASLRSGQRAVTARDYELLTLAVSPAVARARALDPAEPGGPVRLLVVPRAEQRGERVSPGDFMVPDHLFTAIAEEIDSHRLLGTAVEIGAPRFMGVSIAARIEMRPGRDPELTRLRAGERLYADLHPVTGGPDGCGWPWDVPLTAAHVITVLSEVDGVASVADVLLFEADEATGDRAPQGQRRLALEPDALWLSVRHRVL